MESKNISGSTAKKDSDFYKPQIDAICAFCSRSKANAAKLRRADIPGQSQDSWPILVKFVDLTDERRLLAYELVAAAISRSDDYVSGSLTLGKAMQQALEITSMDDLEDNQKDLRMGRLLACTDLNELVRVLRPVLGLIRAKAGAPLDYSQLLWDLVSFCGPDWQAEKTKRKWANDFYSFDPKEKEER